MATISHDSRIIRNKKTVSNYIPWVSPDRKMMAEGVGITQRKGQVRVHT